MALERGVIYKNALPQEMYTHLSLSLIGTLTLKLDLSAVQYWEQCIMEAEVNNILPKEIESWSKFEYALREDDRILFNKMLNECQKEEDYSKAFNAKGEYNSAESLFMALIFQQQKMISTLIDKLSKYQVNQKNNSDNNKDIIDVE
jgi:hypothetical protein